MGSFSQLYDLRTEGRPTIIGHSCRNWRVIADNSGCNTNIVQLAVSSFHFAVSIFQSNLQRESRVSSETMPAAGDTIGDALNDRVSINLPFTCNHAIDQRDTRLRASKMTDPWCVHWSRDACTDAAFYSQCVLLSDWLIIERRAAKRSTNQEALVNASIYRVAFTARGHLPNTGPVYCVII